MTDMNQQMNGMANTAIMPERPSSFGPRTANEAASMVFPKVGEHFQAFWEKQSMDLNQPPSIEILDLMDEFWALTLGPEGDPKSPVVFVPSQGQFRRFNPDKGVYEPFSDAAVMNQFLGNLELVAEFLPRVQGRSFFALKNRQRLKSVVERAKELLAIDAQEFFQDRRRLHLALENGILQLDNLHFQPSAPCLPVTQTLPVKYNPEAKCELFVGTFLQQILEPADIDLLQRYLSQILEGINHSQKILVLTGEAGWGKSSLLKILGTLLGWGRVGIVREPLFKDEYELAHYAGKHLLVHPDLPTDFLDRKEASIFKQLVGGDPLWANTKGDDGRLVIEGHYPVILACNGRPKIHIDEDAEAWLRRLVVLSFKSPSHETHWGKLAEMILRTESSGILNWLVEGRAKLAKDRLQLTMTPEQRAEAAALLVASQSPAVFVRTCLEKRKDSEMTAVDMYAHYQSWCRENHIRSFASQAFHQVARDEIEINLGLKYRHDLAGEQGASRGWKGLALAQKAEDEKSENVSAGSEVKPS